MNCGTGSRIPDLTIPRYWIRQGAPTWHKKITNRPPTPTLTQSHADRGEKNSRPWWLSSQSLQTPTYKPSTWLSTPGTCPTLTRMMGRPGTVTVVRLRHGEYALNKIISIRTKLDSDDTFEPSCNHAILLLEHHLLCGRDTALSSVVSESRWQRRKKLRWRRYGFKKKSDDFFSTFSCVHE